MILQLCDVYKKNKDPVVDKFMSELRPSVKYFHQSKIFDPCNSITSSDNRVMFSLVKQHPCTFFQFVMFYWGNKLLSQGYKHKSCPLLAMLVYTGTFYRQFKIPLQCCIMHQIHIVTKIIPIPR